MLDFSRFLEPFDVYDFRYLRDNFDCHQGTAWPRGTDVPWERHQHADRTTSNLASQVEQLRHELNKGSEEVAKLKRAKQPADAAMVTMKAVGERIKTIEEATTERRGTPDRFESPHPESSTCLGADRKRCQQTMWRPDGGDPRPR